MDPLPIKQVRGCARCGGDHEGIVAQAFTVPVAPPEDEELVWTHWFPCPTNGEPVLVRVTSDA